MISLIKVQTATWTSVAFVVHGIASTTQRWRVHYTCGPVMDPAAPRLEKRTANWPSQGVFV